MLLFFSLPQPGSFTNTPLFFLLFLFPQFLSDYTVYYLSFHSISSLFLKDLSCSLFLRFFFNFILFKLHLFLALSQKKLLFLALSLSVFLFLSSLLCYFKNISYYDRQLSCGSWVLIFLHHFSPNVIFSILNICLNGYGYCLTGSFE